MGEKLDLAGERAIITGAAQGIGEAVAKAFARAGASVAIADLNMAGASQVASEIEKMGSSVLPIQVDVTRPSEVANMVKAVLDRWGTLDILVNNVGGFFKFSSLLEISEEDWDQIMALNLKSVFLCCQAVAGHMMERRKGRIINLASQAGLGPNPFARSYAPYGTAKAGVIGFTKHLAKELGAYGITVNTVSPGTTLTPRVRKIRDPQSIQKIAEMNPLGHMIEPRDVAEAVLFLASEKARSVTGINFHVNAGAAMV